MAVVVSIHLPYATLTISENPNPLKPHRKFNNPCLRFDHLPLQTKHQLRCLSAKSTPSNPDPQSPQDGDELESVGVKAALAMLRFYKTFSGEKQERYRRCYLEAAVTFRLATNTPYKKYGVLKGTVLTTWRLCRCNPLGGSGFDPPRWFGESEIKPQEEDSYDDEDQRQIF